MDAILAGSSTNSRRSLSRARSTTTRNSPSPISDHWDKHRGKRFKSDSSPEVTRSTTTVSSTTSVTMSTDMSPVKDEKERSDYDQALYLLENNPPEQRLDFHLPYSQYLKLEECWSKIKSARNISEDQKYPYLAYNSCAEYVTVVTVPRDLHEVAALELGNETINGARKYLASHGANASVASRILLAGSTTTKGAFGNYVNSKKQADGTIKYKRTGTTSKVMIAIEVGYSEHYAALCRDKDAWIDGQHVKVCILVCLDESPRFRNPRTRHETVGDVGREREAMSQAVAETVERDTSRDYYGQIEYRGHKWVGDLKEAFIEVWRAKKRHPTRYQLIQNAWCSNRLPNTIGLKLRDFIPDEDWEAANIVDGGISFDADLYVHNLRRSMETTADERYYDYISR
ncbi:hypothetical protein V1520DRAFT_370636 [Lipomyces starkeyi]|uniref:Uncharacterized protein n=1 Tax=Lipomyces starkeyi NRRL Y-11557 TaxID=675824 RepID=A0A1E3PVX6_LIPST|nr:hypothetical protein LIPSTDRAFT_6760 [Lipomyces starkeyi NRRL Y-11557]